MLGSWDVNIDVDGGMPQAIATAIGDLNKCVGVRYEPMAYLGSQQVNGTNHAVLAKERWILRHEEDLLVVLFFNVSDNGVVQYANNVILDSVEDVPGGIKIEFQKDIPEEAKVAFDEVFEGWCGAAINPVALVATQVVKGTNYSFLAEVKSVTENPRTTASLVTVNALADTRTFVDLLKNVQENQENATLGYAFTW